MTVGTYVIIGVAVFVILALLLYPTPFWKKKDTYPKPGPGTGGGGGGGIGEPDTPPQK